MATFPTRFCLGKSANNALFQLLAEKNLLPKRKLERALDEAERRQIPLEQILLRQRDLRPTDCKSLLLVRKELGRNCRTCGKITYLLNGQYETETACEFCGGSLLTGPPQRMTRATLRRPAPPLVEPDRSGSRSRPRGMTRAHGRQTVRQPPPTRALTTRQARQTPRPTRVHKPPPEPTRIPRPTRVHPPAKKTTDAVSDAQVRRLVQENLAQQSEKIVREARAKALELLEERLASEKVSGLAERIGQRMRKLEGKLGKDTSLTDKTRGELRQMVRAELGKRELPPELLEEVKRHAMAAVKDRLQSPDLKPLVDKMFDQAVRVFDARLDEDGMKKLVERVDERATQSTELALKEQNLPGWAARVREEALTSAQKEVQQHLKKTVRELPERLVNSAKLGGEIDKRAAAAAAKGLEKKLSDADLEGVSERVARHTLERFQERLGSPDLDAIGEQVTQKTIELLRIDLDTLRDSIREETLEALDRRLIEDDLPGRSKRLAQQTVTDRLAQLDLAGQSRRVQQDILETMDKRLAQDETRLRDQILRMVEARLVEEGLTGLAERVQRSMRRLADRQPAATTRAHISTAPAASPRVGLMTAGLGVLRRRRKSIAGAFLVLAAASCLLLSSLPATYTSEVVVGPTTFDPYPGPAERMAQLVTSREALSEVADQNDVPQHPSTTEWLTGRPQDRVDRMGVEVQVSGGTGQVDHVLVSAQATDPEEANRLATGVSDRLIREDQRVRGLPPEKGAAPLQVLRRAEARETWSPWSWLPGMLALAFFLSLALGAGLELRRRGFNDADELLDTVQLPLLSVVPAAPPENAASE